MTKSGALRARRRAWLCESELEWYEADEIFMFWSHTPRQPWQDQKYYDQQRKILRPAQFSRLHENQWVSSESRFIEPGIWDRNVLPGLRPDPTGALFIGIDASVKHDSTALVCLKYDKHSDSLVLADYRIWVPGPGAPMDFEATLEYYLRRLQGWNTSIEKILVDPYQMHRSLTTLQQAGLPIEPFPQTQPNLTLATETRSTISGFGSTMRLIFASMCSMRRRSRQAAAFD